MERKTEREKDLEALKVLLGHWIQHNYSHNESYQEWMEKCEKHGLSEVAAELQKAIVSFNEATGFLIEAQKNFARLELDGKQ
ncbi:MAG: hypothetical protein ACI3ZR_02185 [bacterium]